jgi:hypothetical protein
LNGMLRIFIDQILIFWIIGGAMENVKIIICAMEILNIPLNKASRVVLVTRIITFGTGFQTNMGRFYSNRVLTSPTCKSPLFRRSVFSGLWSRNCPFAHSMMKVQIIFLTIIAQNHVYRKICITRKS